MKRATFDEMPEILSREPMVIMTVQEAMEHVQAQCSENPMDELSDMLDDAVNEINKFNHVVESYLIIKVTNHE